MKRVIPSNMASNKNSASPSGQNEEDGEPIKIDKWDGSALKNALDDGVKKVLCDKGGCVESHRLMDGRLFVCTIAVGFALFALVWDYIRPFPESRPILILCVVSYFVLMAVLTLYTTYKERGIFLVALEKDKAGIDPDNIWTLSSHLKRYDDVYSLSMVYTDGKTKQRREASMTKSVADFFDEEGKLCLELYEPEIRKLQASMTSEKKEK